MTATTKISGCIIAQDEEHYIERAILNMKPYVDEIIVVDGGSIDKTVSICESLGCNVYHRKFDCHFADQRNYALSMCSNDWVVMLDADEYFSENILSKLQMLIKISEHKDICAVAFKRISYLSEVGSIDAGAQVRLVNKNKGTWLGRLHEVFEPQANFRTLTAPDDYVIFHKKTMNRQLYNNLLYKNIEDNILERPKYDVGLIGEYSIGFEIVKNDRNKL